MSPVFIGSDAGHVKMRNVCSLLTAGRVERMIGEGHKWPKGKNRVLGEAEMQIDWTKTGLGDYDIVAFVHGSKEEREKQKAEIQACCHHVLRDSEFVCNWHEAEKKLAETEPKGRFMLIVSDLGAISRDPDELAERLIVFIETDAVLSPVNKEHEAWLKDNCRKGSRTTLALGGSGGRDRVLLELKKSCRKLLQKEDARRDS